MADRGYASPATRAAGIPAPPRDNGDDPGTVVSIASGMFHTCALLASEGHVFAILADGTIAGWGASRCRELGNGTQDDSPVAARVQSLDHVIGVSSGACHACALTSDGGAQCWSDNNYGVLGSGEDNSFESLTPLPVSW